MNFPRRIFTLIAIFILAVSACGAQAPISESQVFGWWDDGLITPEEASEIFDLIQDGNFEEACVMTQALVLEPCAETRASIKKRSPGAENIQKHPPLAPQGYVSWTARMDSLGNLEKQFADLNIRFYRYSIHLGTRQQLAYKNDGAEAYFGQISSREFHSQIPTDTLWGTSLLYPLKNFQLAAALDTSLKWNASVGYHFSKTITASASYWDSFRTPRAISSGVVQLHTPWLDFAGWYQQGMGVPLLKVQLRQKTGSNSTNYSTPHPGGPTFTFQTTAYYHGDSLPAVSRLSKSILKEKFIGTQQIGATLPSLWNLKLSASARISFPLDSAADDTSSSDMEGRFKVSAETGPSALRGSMSITCLEAGNHCPDNDLQVKLSSRIFQPFTLIGGLKSRYTQGEGFGTPKTDFGLTYQPAEALTSRIFLSFPKGIPTHKALLRTETTLGTAHFKSSLTVTFSRIQHEEFHPVHGIIQLKWLF